jgi:hypothetical protein
MKKAIFFFAFTFVLGTFATNAQSCAAAGKSCCANKVAKAAAADPSIEKRQAEDGSVAYVRKQADAQGNVQFVSVQFDEASNAFVNVAPKALVTDAGMTKKTASCSAASPEAKACAGGAAAGKACAGGAAAGKSCCASKGEASATGTAPAGKACCANKAASSCSEKKAEQ